MTPDERIYEANRAKDVLENEAFQKVFADIEAEIFKQWTESPARDEAGREKLWMYLAMLKKVKSHLESSLESGRLAMLDIEHRKSIAERVGDIWSSRF